MACTPQQIEEARFKLSKVMVRVITSEPFYATMLMQKKPTIREDLPIPTALVDVKGNMYFHPQFVLDHSVEELVGVAIHEVLHKVFFHLMRMRERHPRKWNIATDAIINYLVKQQGYKLPPWHVDFPEEKVKDKTADQVYAEMDDDPEGSGGFDGQGDFLDDGTAPSESDVLETKRAIASAVENAKQRGKMPAGLERLLGDILEPKQDWKQLLEVALTTALLGNDLFTYSKPSVVGRQLGICMPSLSRGVQIRKVVIGIDTSGSIGEEMLRMFVGECRGILHSVGIDECHIVYCDAAIHDVHIVNTGEEYAPDRVGGGGGTAFEPVFDYAEEQGAEALIYLTDMYCSFPERPEYHVVWAATTDIVGPYGNTVHIGD